MQLYSHFIVACDVHGWNHIAIFPCPSIGMSIAWLETMTWRWTRIDHLKHPICLLSLPWFGRYLLANVSDPLWLQWHGQQSPYHHLHRHHQQGYQSASTMPTSHPSTTGHSLGSNRQMKLKETISQSTKTYPAIGGPSKCTKMDIEMIIKNQIRRLSPIPTELKGR